MNDKRHDPGDAELDRLFALARQAPPDVSAVEGNFETRVMARIRELRADREPWYAWAWRLAPIFLALTVLLAGWTVYVSPSHPVDPVAMFASDTREVGLSDYLTGD